MLNKINRHFQAPEFYFSLLLISLLGLGLCLRLFDLTDEPIDFHPTRQLRGAIVARGMYYEMSPSATPDTRQRAVAFWRSTGQYEPPILERLVAITDLALGQEVMWLGRLYNSIFWIVGGIFVFLLAKRLTSAAVPNQTAVEDRAHTISIGGGLIALAYYLVLPFSVQASRSFQPDPGMVVWIILAAYALYRWSETQAWKWALATGLLAGVAVLTKAVAFYTVAGAITAVVIYTFVSQAPMFRWNSLLKVFGSLQVWLIVILTVAPTAIYYLGRGGRASEYLSSWTLALAHLLVSPMTYLRWLNLVQSLVGWLALLLALAGILVARGRARALLIGLWGGYILYGLFLPYQMYTHSYYHLQLVPLVALSIAPAAQVALQQTLKLGKAWQILFAGLAIVWLAYSAWTALIPLYGQNYRNERPYWQEIASYLPEDGKIVALTQDYGYRLMYYGWRKVTLWPNRGEKRLNELRGIDKEFLADFEKYTRNKRYFLITAFRQFDDQPMLKEYLYTNYRVLAEGQGYVIFDLSQPINASPTPYSGFCIHLSHGELSTGFHHNSFLQPG